MGIPFILSASTLVLMVSCGSTTESPPPPAVNSPADQAQIDSVVSAFNFTYGRPMLSDSSTTILLPMSMVEDRYGESSGRSFTSKVKEHNLPPYWNVLFLNPNSLESHLLSDRKMWIRVIQILSLERSESLFGHILYELSDSDGNKDGKVDGEDPAHLCISRTDGRKFTAISPFNEDLISWDILPGTGRILIKTRKDENGDGKFEFREEENMLIYDVHTGQTVPVISEAFKQEIKKSFFHNWLQNE